MYKKPDTAFFNIIDYNGFNLVNIMFKFKFNNKFHTMNMVTKTKCLVSDYQQLQWKMKLFILVAICS